MNPLEVVNKIEEVIESMCFESHQRSLATSTDVCYLVGIMYDPEKNYCTPEIVPIVDTSPDTIKDIASHFANCNKVLAGLIFETSTDFIRNDDHKGEAFVTFAQLINGYKVGFVSEKEDGLYKRPKRVTTAGQGDGQIIDKLFIEYVKIKARNL